MTVWVRSLLKSRKLRKLSRVLGEPMTPESFAASFAAPDGGIVEAKDKAFSALLDLCEADARLNEIISKHGANRETLYVAYQKLLAAGAGQWRNGHYVAASSLAFASTLDFLLDSSGVSDMRKAYALVLYFRDNLVGPVPLPPPDPDIP